MAPLNNICVVLLEKNSKEVFAEASRILIKIADNILNDPTNLKIRTLQKGNSVISSKLLVASGAVECLMTMGFIEESNTFTLPESDTLKNITYIRDELSKVQQLPIAAESSSSASKKSIPKDSSSSGAIPKQKLQTDESAETSSAKSSTPAPQTTQSIPISSVMSSPISSNPFLMQIQQSFHSARSYENKIDQENAMKIVPLKELTENAIKKLLSLQKSSKDKIDYNTATLHDLLLLELLAWYKNSFFKWVDSPECKFCKGKTQFVNLSTDYSYAPTPRVELHKCTTCGQMTPFPRYNDLSVLLTTRRGRCGEWANVFTLLCVAIGWDARYVVDSTDHVWTEVYSEAQKRWLHCDPCENACDTPLMYESGWGKQLSYVLAYSPEEVQDVTWRYTSDHRKTLTRRTRCTEADLVNCLVTLRQRRQQDFSSERRQLLTIRLLHELCELMIERKPNDNEHEGRSSGSLTWRLARGETHVSADQTHTWSITPSELANGKFVLRYSPSLDKYQRVSSKDDNSIYETTGSWEKGIFEMRNVFRKEETDWKMVYIARTEGSSEGNISWKVSIENDEALKVIDRVNLKFTKALYEDGACDVEIVGNDGRTVKVTEEIFETPQLNGCKSIKIRARLSGGKGNVAWQHAQVFRQSTTDSDFPFIIEITFVDATPMK